LTNRNNTKSKGSVLFKTTVAYAIPRIDEEWPFDPLLLDQFVCHILIYAEILFRWGLPEKRLALLKLIYRDFKQKIPPTLQTRQIRQHDFSKIYLLSAAVSQRCVDIVRVCARCRGELRQKENACLSCGLSMTMPSCTVCRLPIKGVSLAVSCHVGV
jgi:hypothetical protein